MFTLSEYTVPQRQNLREFFLKKVLNKIIMSFLDFLQ